MKSICIYQCNKLGTCSGIFSSETFLLRICKYTDPCKYHTSATAEWEDALINQNCEELIMKYQAVVTK